MEDKDIRASEQHFVHLLEQQNRILEIQNEHLKKIISFITPISDFFGAFQLIAKFVGAIAAGIGILWGIWQAAKEYIKTHP